MFFHVYNHIYILKEPIREADREAVSLIVSLDDTREFVSKAAALDACVRRGECAALYCPLENDDGLIILLHYLIAHAGMHFANAYTLLTERFYSVQIDPTLVLELVQRCGLDYAADYVQSRTFFYDRLGDVSRTPSPVLPDLFVGSYAALGEIDGVRALGIQSVLRLDDLYGRGDLQWPAEFTLLDMPIDDGQAVAEALLRQGTAFIHTQRQAGKKVLVHCIGGISRSVTFTIGYLMEYQGMRLADAFSLVVFHRAVAYPHPALLNCLIEYYRPPDETPLPEWYSDKLLARAAVRTKNA
jgi:hypothetical protein